MFKNFVFLIFFCLYPFTSSGQEINLKNISQEDELNIYCLRKSYPQINAFKQAPDGSIWLVLKNGQLVNYSGNQDGIAASMTQPYPLEPERPDTPEGFSPGRLRPYAFLSALYGDNPASVKKGLRTLNLLRRSFSLAEPAAIAFTKAKHDLEKIYQDAPDKRRLLKSDGGFYWRKIAGENNLSAHSYGIALDLGANIAPYWRWNRKSPHPMQKTYPTAIVEALEKRGFIWGGKWHEYDLMHFEYRPELICKALMRAGRPLPKDWGIWQDIEAK